MAVVGAILGACRLLPVLITSVFFPHPLATVTIPPPPLSTFFVALNSLFLICPRQVASSSPCLCCKPPWSFRPLSDHRKRHTTKLDGRCRPRSARGTASRGSWRPSSTIRTAERRGRRKKRQQSVLHRDLPAQCRRRRHYCRCRRCSRCRHPKQPITPVAATTGRQPQRSRTKNNCYPSPAPPW